MQDLLRWIRQTGLENIIWITDVDETLLEKSANPDLVTRVPALEDICERLDRLAGGGFFVITGRELAWLDEAFPNKRIRASCEYHCVFRNNPDKEPEILNPIPHWDLVDEELDALAAQYAGLRLRKKPFMRSLHYSGVPEEKQEEMKKNLEPALQSLLNRHNTETGQIVGMIDGGRVFDMGPGNSDKSHALKDILHDAEQRTGKKFIPVYFGDSPGDLPAAHAAQDAGGKFIAIGPDQRVTSIADFLLEDPQTYRNLIKTVINTAPRPAVTPKAPGLP